MGNVQRLSAVMALCAALLGFAGSSATGETAGRSAAPKPRIEDQSPMAALTEKEGSQPGRLEVPWDSSAPDAQVHHHASSNFGTPPRLRRFVQ